MRRLLAPLALSAAALLAALAAAPAMADPAVLTKAGTLYEVFSARYGDVVPGATGTRDAMVPVLALRTTPASGDTQLEVVDGTFDGNDEGSASIEFDEETGTVFLVYTKFQGFMSDVHVAVRRGGAWGELNVVPNLGLYLSLNPKLVVTRQQFTDFDGRGGTVTKKRSIVSIVWWEETGPSQARYACAFIEDGALNLDSISAFNLNQLAGETGSTGAEGLPFSAYQFPSVQRDPASNGGILVSFANLASQKQSILRISFPDDIRLLVEPGATTATRDAYARSHFPIGRHLRDFSIPRQIDTTAAIDTVVSSDALPTFFWSQGSRFSFLRADAPSDKAPTSISLRSDFPIDRAVALVRGMAEKD